MELENLLHSGKSSICKIGLQRRYWPGNRQIMKKCRQATNYSYQFQTGPHLQGDVFTSLFLHPLDYTRFLFGECVLQSFSKHLDDKGVTIQMHVTHPGDISSGLLQLSTHYSWNPPFDCLQVNGKKESLTIQYPGTVTGRQIPARVMNIPTERLLRQPLIIKDYFSGIPSLNPTAETNSYWVQGFLPEIETFVSLVEGNNSRGRVVGRVAVENDLDSLVACLYGMIEKMRSS